MLLQINAIRLNPQKPFTWASGWKSPIYCDNRKILSYPLIRNEIVGYFKELAVDTFPETNAIAAVATGAIPHGMLLADRMELPFVYVRPRAKDHGLKNQVEGELPENAKVLVIEDLVSTGNSSLRTVETLRQAGAKVLGMAAIFTYAFPKSKKAFELADCLLFTLSDYPALVRQAVRNGSLDKTMEKTLEQWRRNPENWNIH